MVKVKPTETNGTTATIDPKTPRAKKPRATVSDKARSRATKSLSRLLKNIDRELGAAHRERALHDGESASAFKVEQVAYDCLTKMKQTLVESKTLIAQTAAPTTPAAI